jgi:hypothetical protein
LEGLGVKNVVIFYDHLEYFTAIWHNVLPFGIVCCHLVYLLLFNMLLLFGIFITFWYVTTKKNLATLELKIEKGW